MLTPERPRPLIPIGRGFSCLRQTAPPSWTAWGGADDGHGQSGGPSAAARKIRDAGQCRFNANGSDKAASPSREVIPLERQSFPALSDPAHGRLGALPTNQLCPAPMISWGGVLSF